MRTLSKRKRRWRRGGSDGSSVGGEFWAASSDKGLTFTELGRKADYKDKL